jgi:hypothetical protein
MSFCFGVVSRQNMSDMIMHLASCVDFQINNYEVKVIKKHVPSCLVMIEYSCTHEIFKFFVVGVNCDCMLCSNKCYCSLNALMIVKDYLS